MQRIISSNSITKDGLSDRLAKLLECNEVTLKLESLALVVRIARRPMGG